MFQTGICVPINMRSAAIMDNNEEDLIDDKEEGLFEDDIEVVEDEENELHYSVEGLGQFHEIEGQKLFVKTDDCLHCIHDIQVALRKDGSGDSRRIDKYLGQWQVVEKMLVPLFLHYREDAAIWTGVLKLLVILTRPINTKAHLAELSLHLRFLQDYKEALSTQDVFITLMSILMDAVSRNEQTETQINEIQTQIASLEAGPLPKPATLVQPAAPMVVPEDAGETQQAALDEKVLELEREEEQKRIRKERKREKEQKRQQIRHLTERSRTHERNLELVLTLIRHLLEIPDAKQGDSGYIQSRGQMQIQLIKHLSDEGVLDLLVMFAEQVVEQPKYKHLNWLFFEIFYHVCATIPPTELANYDHMFKRDLSKLLDIEKKLVYAQVPRYSRHSRFATASVLKHVPPSSLSAPTAVGGDQSIAQKSARNRHYRERRIQNTEGEQVPNLFQDPSFIDINIGRLDVDGAGQLLPSSILGKDYRDFYSDIKAFIDQFTDSVFGHLMQSVYSEIEQESKNLHDYDTVRVLNMITWILDYQVKLFRKTKKLGTVSALNVQWAVSQDAVSLVTRQVKQHSKEGKTIKAGGANLVVALRAFLAQLLIARSLGADNGDAFTIMDSFCYDELYGMLTWTLRNFKPTANRPEVLNYSLECIDEYLRLADSFEKKLATQEAIPKQAKKRKPKISQAEAELQGMDFYDDGHSDSDASIRTSDDDDGRQDNMSFLESVREARASIMTEVCHSEAIKHLFLSLSKFKENPQTTNTAIASIILRITQHHEAYVAYFFQLSSLVTLYNIINDPTLRSVEEERIKYDSIILIAKLIIRKFIKVARINELVFIEVLYPRAMGGRGGSLFSIEGDLMGICTNYADEETRVVLERIHQGDTYTDLKAERREQQKYSQPWTEDEDQQLIGLWDHVKGIERRTKRDKINTIVANLVPLEGKKKRKFKEIKLRLISLGLIEATEGSDYYSSDDDDEYRHRDDDSESGSRSEDSEPEDGQGLNFQEYVKRVNAVKVSDELTSIFDNLLALNIGLTDDDHGILGEQVFRS